MDNETMFDVIISNRNVIVKSTNVADIFHKRHKNVLRRIESLKSDWSELTDELGPKVSPTSEKFTSKVRATQKEPSPKMDPANNALISKVRSVTPELGSKVSPVKHPKFKDCFYESEYITPDGRLVKCYDMNRMGFTILTSSFNGKDALEFKIQYATRFDQQEAELARRNTLYELEKQQRKQLTDAISYHYTGDDLGREIQKLTDLLYISCAGHKASKLKHDRGFDKHVSAFADVLTSEERSKYIRNENQLIIAYATGEHDYHELKSLLLPVTA
jgi:phage regulator Rha-like protein